jgi:hypothetical protein
MRLISFTQSSVTLCACGVDSVVKILLDKDPISVFVDMSTGPRYTESMCNRMDFQGKLKAS